MAAPICKSPIIQSRNFKMSQITEALRAEMKAVFPPVAMPVNSRLRFHPEGCFQCDYLAKELEECRGKPVNGSVIRLLHQEMSCLSAKGWAWALPHYLPFCLTPEAEYNQMETEFLIYNLAPGGKFEAETRDRLSALSRQQLTCLVHFLAWLKTHPKWSTYCPSEIDQAHEFVSSMTL